MASDNGQWEASLRSVSSYRAYHWLYGAEISALKIAEFLILYKQMPRSLAFCCDQMNDNLGLLQRTYGEETEAIRMGAAIDRDRLSRPIQSTFEIGSASCRERVCQYV